RVGAGGGAPDVGEVPLGVPRHARQQGGQEARLQAGDRIVLRAHGGGLTVGAATAGAARFGGTDTARAGEPGDAKRGRASTAAGSSRRGARRRAAAPAPAPPLVAPNRRPFLPPPGEADPLRRG